MATSHPNTTGAAAAAVDPIAELLESQVEYVRTQHAHEAAKARRARARTAVRSRFRLGVWSELPELGKRIRRRRVRGARTFSLSGYEAAGHPVTPEMEDHISRASSRDEWDIEDA